MAATTAAVIAAIAVGLIQPETRPTLRKLWVACIETGRTLQTNASLAAASDQANVRLSLSRTNQDGLMPGFSLGRTNVGLNGGINLSDRLSATGSAQYIGSDGAGRPGIGYGETNPMIQFIWFGRQVDMQDLKANYNALRPEGDTQEGRPYSWNYSYHPNPYFLQQRNGNRDQRAVMKSMVSTARSAMT